MMDEQKEKKPVGRPPRVVPPIADTFENVVKAVVQPLPKQPQDDEES